MGNYCIYKFTNLKNGKGYVGKTTRLKRRYDEHVKGCIWKTVNPPSILSKAIAKYGLDNFLFEVICECETFEEMSIKETEYILKFNTLKPNGYNLRLEDQNKNKMHESTKNVLSKIGQGIRHAKKEIITSQYIGVHINCYGKYVTHVRINRKIKSKTFTNEIEAAESYDKMVLFLYGKDARINFEQKRQEYLNTNLQEFYTFFITSSIQKKSMYYGVSQHKNGKWCIKIQDKYKKKYNIPSFKFGLFNDEKDAAIIVDKINYYYNINEKYNFPELMRYYNKTELEKWFHEKLLIKKSKYEGVSLHKNGKWRAYYYVNRKYVSVGNHFHSEDEAYIARTEEMKKLQNTL